jgi:hypothetical protein
MDPMELMIEIAKQGLLGVVAVVAMMIASRKDKQVTALYDRLERKSDKAAEKYHELSTEMNETLKALTDAIEE